MVVYTSWICHRALPEALCENHSEQKSFVHLSYMRNTFPSYVRGCVRLLLFACGSAQRHLTAIRAVIQHSSRGVAHRGHTAQTMKPVQGVQTRHLHNNGSSHAGQSEKEIRIGEKKQKDPLVRDYSAKISIEASIWSEFSKCWFMSVRWGAFHMDVVHPQIHLSRTSPPGAQSQGTTAQIDFLPIHGPKNPSSTPKPENTRRYTYNLVSYNTQSAVKAFEGSF